MPGLARAIGYLHNAYVKLPVKPFRGVLGRLYWKYKKSNRDRTVMATIGGITYELDLNELIDNSIYYEGCFELFTTAVIDKYVKSGMTVFDIGANIGGHTLRCAKLVGRSGKVIAFEPMPWAFSKLKRNVELNDFNNIVFEKFALSNVTGRQCVYFKSSWGLEGRSALDSEGSREVDFITLDEYVEGNNISKIDFIKLDVDGYEYKVVRGGVNSIKKFKPVMIIEFGKWTLRKYGDSLEDLIDLLASLGYSFYSEKGLSRYRRKKLLLDAIPEHGATINVLCKP
ncbi:MAG TPA: FkbM family methyltransferase [Dehalococcoidia bacterium]|nr:FkbM family methyltransferase [Dehalococcoidia bacterium]